jgi:hypothetical protein
MAYEPDHSEGRVKSSRSAARRVSPRSKSAASRRSARLAGRLDALDWNAVEAALDEDGYARARGVLTPSECGELVSMFAHDARFRSRVDMGRHRFGAGDYAYFALPLPAIVATLRSELYARLAPLANRMAVALGRKPEYPRELAAYTRICHRAGQTRPTPLLLHYRAGGYNRLHRDLYGAHAFPLQVTILLSRPAVDFSGGEFLLLEDRPRQQARCDAIALEQGEMIVFPVRERPVASGERFVRAVMRHGVSRVQQGERYTLGLIFHDAE